MYKLSIISLVGLAACTSSQQKDNTAQKQAQKPNVIIILTDDQGYGDFNVNGNPYLETPNLDKLHSESIRFTDFHVSPMSAPTRGQLMTGVHCMKNGCMCTSMGRSTVHEDIPMMSNAFVDAGYNTGIFGKWHMGYNYPHRPIDRGFNKAIYFNGFGLTGMGHHWNSGYYDPYYYDNGELKQAEGYCNDFWFGEAMKWMKKNHDNNKPFFCYLPTNLPHGPEWVDTTYSSQFEESGAKDFYGMIANVDKNMGKLSAFLKENGMRENTILVYLTDNGTIHSEVYNAGMRGGKCSRFDGGHRVPCYVSWPNGDLVEPADINTPVQVQDMFPTLIDLCKIEKPDNARFDGISLKPLLKGGCIDDRMFVIQYQQNHLEKYDATVVWKNWRLVLPWGDQLFDISTDPGQEKIISDQYPEIVKKMKDYYEQWWKTVELEIDSLVYNHIGTKQQPEVILYSSDWMDARADANNSARQLSVRPLRGTEFNGGIWNIDVQQAGKYRVELRRYPREADAAICAGVPRFEPRFGDPIPAGKPANITQANLETANGIKTKKVSKTDQAITFIVDLKKGKTQIRAWFGNEQEPIVCGAYYAYVKLD